MKVSDYNLTLIITSMLLGLAGQLYSNYNIIKFPRSRNG